MPQLSLQEARRVAVRAQLLQRERPADLITVVRRLTFLQLDPVSAIAPSADLVAWTRLGSTYSPDDLARALGEGTLVELDARIRPAEDICLYRAEMAAWPGTGKLKGWQEYRRDWVAANDRCRRDILAALGERGPLPSRELPDTCDQPWASTGWTNDKNVMMLLEFMARRGEVAVAGRQGRDRLWDLAERVYPDGPVLPLEEALRERDRRRLRALGIARASGPKVPLEPAVAGEAGVGVTVEGTTGQWRVDPELLDQPFAGRAALLSPFDRLVHDRTRAEQLFGFSYRLEMYKPAARRRWGYYALPVLCGDRLLGKLDAAADRTTGVLRVNALHEDVPLTSAERAEIDAEIGNLATWLGLEVRGRDDA